ncbi:hypothetical protein [Virgisporangium aurantiacum]|uniref:Uncharacterized protein n=1 Tax=Virgisporangium aurantiacum TaxID=175570 RepID=A0A8J3ZP65_9ACTN|nr:hypothetical protein [Virgisporangium aurantiacum]GIJ65015.1 hypothetical protein Vau01_125310 [Virgisporangium aurantiacum]
MTPIEATSWGLLGGFAVEGLQFAAAVRRCGDWPWTKRSEPNFGPFIVSVFIRLAVGAGLAAAAAAGGQLGGPFAAVAVGASAPLLVEQLAQQVPITPGQRATPGSGGDRPPVAPRPRRRPVQPDPASQVDTPMDDAPSGGDDAR